MKYFSSSYYDLCYILAALSAQAMLCLPIWRVKTAVLPVMVRFVSRTLMMLQGQSVSFAPLLTLTSVKIPSSAVMLLIGISPYSIKYCKVLCIISTVLTVVSLLKEGCILCMWTNNFPSSDKWGHSSPWRSTESTGSVAGWQRTEIKLQLPRRSTWCSRLLTARLACCCGTLRVGDYG